jgi:VWFA-related protein
MTVRTLALLCVVWAALGAAPAARARQSPTATPAPPRAEPGAQDEQEPVRIYTQEVKLPVTAYDDRERFHHALEPDDVLVLEEGVPQKVRSVRRLPANILLVFDTSGQVTGPRSSHLAREAALRFLSSLRPGDQVAVIQNSDRVTLLQDWTEDTNRAATVVSTKYFSANRSRLSECLTAAAGKLRERPTGSTHVVVFTDGLEAQSREEIRAEEIQAEAVRSLAAAQAAVHLFCFTSLVKDFVRHRNSPVTIGGNGNTVKVIVDTDMEMRRWFRNYARAAEARQQQLVALARDAGGRVLLPASPEEVSGLVDKLSRDIGAQYVVTYTPKLLLSRPGERRKIDVSSRRLGLHLFSLRTSVVASPE